MLPKLVIPSGVFLLLACSVAVVWSARNLPPPLRIVKYGLHPGCEPTGEVVPAEGVEFVVIGRGWFRMGSTENGKPGTLVGRLCGPVGIEWGESPEPSDEMPVHWVEFPNGFALAKTAITNAQYEAFAPDHERPRTLPDDRDPVVNVSWDDATAYCAWLAEKSGRSVRLPSESEWEAACRAGSESEYCFGDDEKRLGEYAWYGANSDGRPHEVASKKPNAWGIYDLHGNVWEWCQDDGHTSYVETWFIAGGKGPATVEEAPTDGSAWGDGSFPVRVVRGGGFDRAAEFCRSAFRGTDFSRSRRNVHGFRPAMTVPSDPRVSVGDGGRRPTRHEPRGMGAREERLADP